jgi:hypothetical protein
MKNFLERAEGYRSRIDRYQQYGNPAALSVIHRYLPKSRKALAPPYFYPNQAELGL